MSAAVTYPNIPALEAVQQAIMEALGSRILSASITHGELALSVAPEQLIAVLTFLRDDARTQFTQLIDLCGADYPSRPARFDVVYNLLSMRHNLRLRVKAQVAENAAVPSVIGLYPCAGWWERETWDMYGIPFAGNPDLRRILTDYGFEGFPLRKDFPLTGYVEVRYDPERRQVVYEPVKLMQDFRSFDYLSPWEGAKYILPGDEKAAPTPAPAAPAKPAA